MECISERITKSIKVDIKRIAAGFLLRLSVLSFLGQQVFSSPLEANRKGCNWLLYNSFPVGVQSSGMRSTIPALTTASQPTSENSSSIGTHHSPASISPRSPARNWEYRSQYHPASRSSITLICSIDLFACSVCNRTHKLLTNFSKNCLFYCQGRLRPGNFNDLLQVII